jgi:superfamily II DNA or RNA helicase
MLRPYQKNAITSIRDAYHRGVRRMLAVLPTGCHERGQGILMYDGSIKPVEEIIQGEQLMGPDSLPRRVEALVRGEGEMCCILPEFGPSWIVNRQHVLTVIGRIDEEPQIIDVAVEDYLTWDDELKGRFKLMRVGVDFPPRSDIAHDAYSFGLGIGRDLQKTRCQEQLLPAQYKLAVKRDRLRLLAGIYDSALPATGISADLISISFSLLEEIAYVGRSLGFYAEVTRENTTTGPSHRLSLRGNFQQIPCKREHGFSNRNHFYPAEVPFAVCRLGRVKPYFGFQLSRDGRYLLEDFTVTHNSGKTVIFSHLLAQRSGRSLVMAHREELLDQAAAKIRAIIPGASIGIVQGKRNQFDEKIVAASVATLANEKRLDQLGHDFQTVIIDEAHHAVSPSYLRILRRLGCFESSDRLTLGVTATPTRDDKRGLDSVFEEIVFDLPILDLVKAGYLCDIKAVQIALKADFNTLQTRASDFMDGELETMLVKAKAPDRIVDAYLSYAQGRKAMMFTPTVHLAHTLVTLFRQVGIPSEAVDGSVTSDMRGRIIERFRKGNTRVLANCNVLTEGTDIPITDCIIVARPTRSRALYTQMIGRGLRTWAGKRDCLILDMVGATTRHDIQTASTLFGMLPGDLSRHSLVSAWLGLEVQSHLDRKVEGAPVEECEGSLVAAEVDIFTRERFNWIDVSGTQYVLAAPEGCVFLDQEVCGSYSVYYDRGKHGTSVIAAGLTLEYAMGAAEDAVRRLKATHLADRNAPWRNLQPTERQLTALHQFKIPLPAKLTRGHAHDLISIEKVKLQRRRLARQSLSANGLTYGD